MSSETQTYAIIEDSGTQIKVSEGDTINVAVRELADDAATLTFDRVLMIGGEGEAKIGAPLLDGAKVTADILEEGRTKKVPVTHFKRRKTHLTRNSHRQDFLKVKITSIAG